MTFEERIARLEQIAAQLEGRDLELAGALALFEEGVEQLRAAAAELSRAETRLEKLIERVDGTFDIADNRE
jgi:exodeoxyribonuclease VII small subunit